MLYNINQSVLGIYRYIDIVIAAKNQTKIGRFE